MENETTLTPNKIDPGVEMAQNINKINSIVSESLGIGIPGADPTENITSQHIDYSGSAARNLHRSLDIVSRIIDSPPADALRNGFEITTNYDDIGLPELIQDRLNELKFNKKAFQFLVDTRLYNRGGLFYPVVKQAGMDASRNFITQPLDRRLIEKIEGINNPPQEMLSWEIQNYDPFARGFGDISRMFIQGHTTAFNRFHHFIQGLDIYRNRGVSVLDKIVVACKGLSIAEWTVQNLLLRYRALIVKYPASEATSKTPKRQRALKALIDKIKTQFTAKSVAAVPNNYEFQYLETKFAGLKEATDFLYEYLATVSRVPQSIIKGSARGELASAEKDQRDYYEDVQAFEQERKLKPLLDFFIPFLLWEKEGKINQLLRQHGLDPDTIKWDIEFNPLQSVNPLQDSQINLIDAQTAAMKIDKGILKSEEVRKEMHPDLDVFIPPQFSEDSQFSSMGLTDLNTFMDQFKAMQTDN